MSRWFALVVIAAGLMFVSTSKVAADISGYQGSTCNAVSYQLIARVRIAFVHEITHVVYRTESDGYGNYRINLPIGRYYVEAGKRGFQPNTSYPGFLSSPAGDTRPGIFS